MFCTDKIRATVKMRMILVVSVIVLTALVYGAQCVPARKPLKPLDKSANVDFINMEGGGIRPASGPVKPAQPAQTQPIQPAQTQPIQPAQPQPAKPSVPNQPKPGPTVHHASTSVVNQPNFQVAEPLKPQPKPVTANVITPQPVRPPSPAQVQPTPGPGSVQSLINYYDSRGQASPIRPYSYTQAVKQG